MYQSINQSEGSKMSQNSIEQAVKDRHIYMTTTPIRKLIVRLAIPTIISMLVTGLYSMADTFFVGRISTNATAAVGIVFSLMSMIQAIGFFCGQGSGTFVSRRLGAGDIREANEMAATGFFLAFGIGLIVSVIGQLTVRPLALLLGATPVILEDTVAYMRFILIGAPFMMSQLVVNNQLRFQGSAVYAMAGLVSGALLNIVLDPIFIFVFKMGVAGAALATILAQIISFFVLLYGSYQGPNIRIHIKNVRLSGHYLLQIVNGGTPSLFRQGLASITTVILNSTAASLGGEAAIAAMSVVSRVMMLAISALIGFGQGFQPVCAFNYGAGLKARVREAYWFCVKYGTAFLLVMATLCFIFSGSIIGFFRDDPEVIAIGRVALRCQAFIFPLNASVVIANMMMQSMGKGVKASVLAAGRNGLFFIPCVLILTRLFGLTGLEISQACADFLTFLMMIPLTRSILRELDG